MYRCRRNGGRRVRDLDWRAVVRDVIQDVHALLPAEPAPKKTTFVAADDWIGRNAGMREPM